MDSKPNLAKRTKRGVTNEDTISAEAGAHPMGPGLGAALGGVFAAGTVDGPIETEAGTVAGGIAGAYAGKVMAEYNDPTVEAKYWRDVDAEQPGYSKNHSCEDFEPAYRSGWESFESTSQLDRKEQEAFAMDRWESEGGATIMVWDPAKLAAGDACRRIDERSGNKPR